MALEIVEVKACMEKILELLGKHSPGYKKIVDIYCTGPDFISRLPPSLKEYHMILGNDLRLDTLYKIFRPRDGIPTLKYAFPIYLYTSSPYDRDPRLMGLDAIVCIEGIAHMNESQLNAFTWNVFECYKPQAVIVSVFNTNWPKNPFRTMNLTEGKTPGWNPDSFKKWANATATKHSYRVKIDGIIDPKGQYIGHQILFAAFDSSLREAPSLTKELKFTRIIANEDQGKAAPAAAAAAPAK